MCMCMHMHVRARVCTLTRTYSGPYLRVRAHVDLRLDVPGDFQGLVMGCKDGTKCGR